MIKYEVVKKRGDLFLSMFGVKIADFELIRARVESLWQSEVVEHYKRPGRFYKLDLTEKIMMLLLYYRHYITQKFVGMLFDIDKANVCRIIQKLEPLLKQVLELPKREGLSPEELHDMIIDATENPIERPKYNQEQYYSGKKKRHTLKTEIRVTKKGRIVHISDTVPGTVHDFKLLEDGEEIPQGTHAWADSGYDGLKNIHEDSETVKKKPKNGELTDGEKAWNRALSQVRVIVENILGDIKVFRIMSDRYRNKKIRFNLKFRIIAGIVNLKNGFGLA
jgi:hypothetical protein